MRHNFIRALCALTITVIFAPSSHAQFLVKTPQMRQIWQPQSGTWPRVLDYSPDGKTVAFFQYSYPYSGIELHEFGSEAKRALKSVTPLNANIDEAEFSPDGQLVAGFTWNYWENATAQIVVWNVKTGREIAAWEKRAQYHNGLYGILWPNSGLTLRIVSDKDNEPTTLQTFDSTALANGVFKEKSLVTISGSEKSEKGSRKSDHLILSSDGLRAALFNKSSIIGNGTITILDATTGKTQLDFQVNFDGYNVPIMLFSPDARRLLVGARVIEIESGQSVTLEGKVEGSRAFSPDGTLVIGGNVRLWDAKSGRMLGGVNVPDAVSNNYANPAMFSSDSHSAITIGNKLIRWDIEKLRALNGRVLDVPQPGAPETTDTNLNPQAFGNNYGFSVVRQGVVVSEKPRQTVLTWRVRDETTQRIVGDLPTAIYYGEESRAASAISSDGHLVAVASSDGRTGNTNILLYDVAKKRALKTLRVVKDSISGLQFSPDSRHLATTSEGKRARVFETQSGELKQLWRVQPQVIRSDELGGQALNGVYKSALAWSRDGRSLALPHSDGKGANVRIVDVASGQTTRVLRSDNPRAVESLAWSRDGKTVAAGGAPVRVWDLRSGRVGRALSTFSMGQDVSDGSTRYVGFTRDGDLLAGDGAASKRWKMNWLQSPLRDESLASLNYAVARANFAQNEIVNWDNGYIEYSPDGKLLAARGRNGVGVWRIADRKLLRQSKALEWPRFSPDGRSLVDVIHNKVLRFDVATGRLSQRNVIKTPLITLRASDQKSTAPIVLSLTDARIVADFQQRVLVNWKSYPEWIISSGVSPDGKTVVASDGNVAWAWELAPQKRRAMENVGDATLYELQISPDGKLLAGANLNGFVHIWNVQSGELLRTLSGHVASAYALAFSRDSNRLASGGADNTVRLWNVQTGALVKVFGGHQAAVLGVAWSPDGQTIASRSQDGTVKLWSAP